MADITQLRYAQALKRLFAIKTADPGRILDPVVKPIYDLSDAYRPEERAMRGELSWSAMQSGTNVAATNFQIINVNNPAGSGKLAIVKRVTVGGVLPTAANQPGQVYFYIGLLTGSGVSSLLLRARDGRFLVSGSVRQPVTGLSTATSGVFTPPSISYYATQFLPGAATQLFFHQVDNLDLVVAPGQGLPFSVAASVLPVATWSWDITFEGYERILDPSELILPP